MLIEEEIYDAENTELNANNLSEQLEEKWENPDGRSNRTHHKNIKNLKSQLIMEDKQEEIKHHQEICKKIKPGMVNGPNESLPEAVMGEYEGHLHTSNANQQDHDYSKKYSKVENSISSREYSKGPNDTQPEAMMGGLKENHSLAIKLNNKGWK